MVESQDLKANSAQEKAIDTSEASDSQQEHDELNSLEWLDDFFYGEFCINKVSIGYDKQNYQPNN